MALARKLTAVDVFKDWFMITASPFRSAEIYKPDRPGTYVREVYVDQLTEIHDKFFIGPLDQDKPQVIGGIWSSHSGDSEGRGFGKSMGHGPVRPCHGVSRNAYPAPAALYGSAGDHDPVNAARSDSDSDPYRAVATERLVLGDFFDRLCKGLALQECASRNILRGPSDTATMRISGSGLANQSQAVA